MLKQPPHGIIPAMVTPLDRDEAIHEASLRRLTNHLIDGGVHGVFSVGTQGEFWAFAPDEKRRIWEIVVDEARGRVPVYAGTVGVTTRQTIELTQLAAKSGADAVSILTPYYIQPTADQLYDHYRAVAESTDLPIVVYSNPSRTGIRLSVDLLARLSGIRGIVGIKDSSGEIELMAEYLRVVPPEFSVLVGPDTLIFAALAIGAKGAIAATANVKPDLVVSIYDRFMAGDLEGARQAQRALAPLRLAISMGTPPAVIKEALDMMGMQAGPARAPVGPLSAEQRERLRAILHRIGAL